ncbi:hypothetical protein HAX54_001386 [Datura stramonium]|uniref:Uncharacterized protein n=1 Tax=Datura stramonium TaxID=4076 RepID=A0ABS8WQN3_DATST|nr:hypothetical protein [Datura stramonium]
MDCLLVHSVTLAWEKKNNFSFWFPNPTSNHTSFLDISDLASPLFKGQVLAVTGDDDTATEEAIYLTKYASHVHLPCQEGPTKGIKGNARQYLIHAIGK